jgi:hypothetical protein
MTTYQATTRGAVVIRDDGVQVPVDNPEVLAWLAAGNVLLPAAPDPPPDPVEVADNGTLDALKAEYQTLRAGLDAIQADLAPGATLRTHAGTLANFNFSGTQANQVAQIENLLHSIGTDLGDLLVLLNREANGLERVLDGLAVFVRRTRGEL